ncbi:type II toxin-antitoxin system HicA family toxin [Patescibacteria group bacterium]|nr:type II toxin-antitoxin system HicA family toxin [Patescibacteria group bacterium]MBU4454947.1 type II toxin-antitoxin system HicA family toxin [Patescibacteria group bacterium]MCG2690679.1 type II toxin-antitoxin system HicA family toxin [Candidatus Parcubacteria bacterium]
MGILSNISGKEAVKVFKKIGYYLDHQQGSHMILYNDQHGYPPLCIPNHKELAPGLLAAQIKRAKLTVDEFNQMRKGGKG